jgi:hypothetical protein
MADEIDLTQVQALITQGLSQREIARRLQIPRSTLQSRLKQIHQEQAPPMQAHVTAMAPRRRGPLSTAGPPSPPSLPPEFVTLLSDLPALQELAQWWRERKLQRVSPSGPKSTERWTIHVERQWIDRVKDEAEVLGVPIMTVVNRALEQYFEGR